ncbi:MAG: hypothetical protein HXY34_10845 [Candidatus Thorarchaeota archaeon]|nr:hypothetical protein [Candidatus Thorarchaeota archaeon]
MYSPAKTIYTINDIIDYIIEHGFDTDVLERVSVLLQQESFEAEERRGGMDSTARQLRTLADFLDQRILGLTRSGYFEKGSITPRGDLERFIESQLDEATLQYQLRSTSLQQIRSVLGVAQVA